MPSSVASLVCWFVCVCRAQVCPRGSYCVAGVAALCPAGTFRDSVGARALGDCAACPAGFFCQVRVRVEAGTGTGMKTGSGVGMGVWGVGCVGSSQVGIGKMRFVSLAVRRAHLRPCRAGLHVCTYEWLCLWACACVIARQPVLACVLRVCPRARVGCVRVCLRPHEQAGANSTTPCGPDTGYCPANSSSPTPVTPGFRAVGNVGQRSDVAPCWPGSFCPVRAWAWLGCVSASGLWVGARTPACKERSHPRRSRLCGVGGAGCSPPPPLSCLCAS
jgi:hypothetical protein